MGVGNFKGREESVLLRSDVVLSGNGPAVVRAICRCRLRYRHFVLNGIHLVVL